MPGDNVLPFARPGRVHHPARGLHDQAPLGHPPRPARAVRRGEYPNQHPGGAGLPSYVEDDAPIENTDLVVWYTFGSHHIVRPGGLAGDAGDDDRLPAQAQRLLRPESRPRRPPSDAPRPVLPSRLERILAPSRPLSRGEGQGGHRPWASSKGRSPSSPAPRRESALPSPGIWRRPAPRWWSTTRPARESADRVVKEIADQGGRAVAVQADLGRPADIQRLLARGANRHSAGSTSW